jgi:hypothetical protein
MPGATGPSYLAPNASHGQVPGPLLTSMQLTRDGSCPAVGPRCSS